MRPTWRLLGAMALGVVVYFYGATSEVAWLFLFGFLLWGAVVAMLFYARWNARGLEGGVRLLEVTPSELSPIFEIPERDFRDAPLPAPVLLERYVTAPSQYVGLPGSIGASSCSGIAATHSNSILSEGTVIRQRTGYRAPVFGLFQ